MGNQKINSGIERIYELDKKYPNRRKQIHKVSCQYCPSERGSDPEMDDLKATVSKEVYAKEYAFVCAWRNSKLCKGNCDFMGIDQQFLDNLYKNKD